MTVKLPIFPIRLRDTYGFDMCMALRGEPRHSPDVITRKCTTCGEHHALSGGKVSIKKKKFVCKKCLEAGVTL